MLLLSSIHTAINLMGLPAHYTQVILGLLVLAAVLLDTRQTPSAAEARMSARLQDRVALIIGAARGIGAGIAERFVEEGARVVIADTEVAAGDATARALTAGSSTPTSRKGRRRARRETALNGYGALDILVQNAGIYPWTLIENTRPEEWDKVLAVNLKGTFLAARAALPS